MEYPIMFNNSNETASYSGSKGVGLCKGILIQDATDGGLSISAINSKGKQGCFIDIPAESVKAVANALLNAIGETTFQLGAPEESEFFYSLNMSGRSFFHMTNIECDPEHSDPDVIVRDAIENGVIDPDDALDIVNVSRIDKDEYNKGMGITSGDVISGTFTSEWSDGESITTKATLNLSTGKIDADMSDDDSDHGSLEREYFTDENDNEYEICSCCHEYISKTEMVDDPTGSGQHEETRCAGNCE